MNSIIKEEEHKIENQKEEPKCFSCLLSSKKSVFNVNSFLTKKRSRQIENNKENSPLISEKNKTKNNYLIKDVFNFSNDICGIKEKIYSNSIPMFVNGVWRPIPIKKFSITKKRPNDFPINNIALINNNNFFYNNNTTYINCSQPNNNRRSCFTNTISNIPIKVEHNDKNYGNNFCEKCLKEKINCINFKNKIELLDYLLSLSKNIIISNNINDEKFNLSLNTFLIKKNVLIIQNLIKELKEEENNKETENNEQLTYPRTKIIKNKRKTKTSFNFTKKQFSLFPSQCSFCFQCLFEMVISDRILNNLYDIFLSKTAIKTENNFLNIQLEETKEDEGEEITVKNNNQQFNKEIIFKKIYKNFYFEEDNKKNSFLIDSIKQEMKNVHQQLKNLIRSMLIFTINIKERIINKNLNTYETKIDEYNKIVFLYTHLKNEYVNIFYFSHYLINKVKLFLINLMNNSKFYENKNQIQEQIAILFNQNELNNLVVLQVEKMFYELRNLINDY